MADYNLVPAWILENSSPAGRDRILRIAYNLRQDDLNKLRTGTHFPSRIHDAAALLYQAGGPSQVTHLSIAAIVAEPGEKLESVLMRVARNLRRIYNTQVQACAQGGLTFHTNYFLINGVGEELKVRPRRNSNLEEAKLAWPKIEIAGDDGDRGLCLPLKIDERVLALVSTLKGDGFVRITFNTGKREQLPEWHSTSYCVQAYGRHEDMQFYKTLLKPLFYQVFNIDPEIRRDYQEVPLFLNAVRKKRLQPSPKEINRVIFELGLDNERNVKGKLIYTLDGKPISLVIGGLRYAVMRQARSSEERGEWSLSESPRLILGTSSKAAATWLVRHMKVSDSAERRFEPIGTTLDERVTELAFVLATGGTIRPGKSDLRYELIDESIPYLEGIAAHAQKLEFRPKINKKDTVLSLVGEDVIRLVEEGLLVNPRHIKQAMKNPVLRAAVRNA